MNVDKSLVNKAKIKQEVIIIAYTKKCLQSDWLKGVQYWPYLYFVFNICTL